MSGPIFFFAIYAGIPLLLLILFGFKRPNLAPLTIALCPVIDFIVYYREFFYYESRPLILLLTAAQVAVVAVLSLLIRSRGRR